MAVASDPLDPPPPQLYSVAARAYNKGDLVGAASICANILKATPRQADCLYLMGLIARRRRRIEDSLAFLQRAIAIRPHAAPFHNALGLAYLHGQRNDLAEASYREAIRLNNGYVEAINNLGNLLATNGQLAEGVYWLKMAVERQPRAPITLTNLGHALRSQGNFAEAANAYQSALVLEPEMPEATVGLAKTWIFTGQPDRAAEPLARVVSKHPKLIDAQQFYAQALIDASRWSEAEAALRNAIIHSPEEPRFHVSLGMIRMMWGDFAEGYAEYEWRLRIPGLASTMTKLGKTQWDGRSLDGRALLVIGEQGFGDNIMYARFIAAAKQRSAKVLALVDPNLISLMESLEGLDGLVRIGQKLPPIEAYAAICSLPYILGIAPDAAATAPYLSPPAARVERWARALAHLPHPRIGICWQGSNQLPNDQRSLSLRELQPILQERRASFVALQHRGATAEIEAQGLRGRIFDPTSDAQIDGDGAFADFGDTAGLIANLDLVITVDTALAHLAGALAAPTWIMLPKIADWRWQLERSDSPLYPSARLFRQTRLRAWGNVVAEVAAEMTRALDQTATP